MNALHEKCFSHLIDMSHTDGLNTIAKTWDIVRLFIILQSFVHYIEAHKCNIVIRFFFRATKPRIKFSLYADS